MFRIHRLVAELFIPNPLGLPIVNHIDSNVTNNRFDNLEWTTQKGNMQQALKRGSMIITVENFKSLHNNKDYCLKKPVVQMDLDDKILNVFESKSIAAEYAGVSACAITNCCIGKTKTSGGYKWKYFIDLSYNGDIIKRSKKNTIDIDMKNNIRMGTIVVQMDINLNVISEFKSIKSAARFINRDPKGIRQSCNGKNITCGGYVWRYKSDFS